MAQGHVITFMDSGHFTSSIKILKIIFYYTGKVGYVIIYVSSSFELKVNFASIIRKDLKTLL